MIEGAINNLAFEIGDYLASQVEPKNEQERVLADLWSVARSRRTTCHCKCHG